MNIINKKLCSIVGGSKVKSTVQKISKFTSIMETIKSIGKDFLVIFDIDDVLIMPKQDHNLKHPDRNQLWLQLIQQYSTIHNQLLESIILTFAEYCIVDPYTTYVFRYLKHHKIPTIALTAIGTGKLGIIDSLENFRINTLKTMNLNFSKLTTLNNYILANDLVNAKKIYPHCVGVPLLKSGIIFTAGIDKGTVLDYILKKTNYDPQTIIFVDDCLQNIESLK